MASNSLLSNLAEDCKDALDKCLSLPGVSKGQFGHLLEDQRGLFSTWAENARIFDRSRSSLDYRLREAPYVKTLVLELLNGLRETIVESLVDVLSSTEGEFAADPDRDLTKDDDFLTNTKPFIEACIDSIASDIGLLQRMSVAMRYSSTSKQNKHAASPEQLESALFFTEMMRHLVRGRFPGAQEHIVDRIALSMTIRRNRILYRRHRFHGDGIQLAGSKGKSKAALSRSDEPSRMPTIPVKTIPAQHEPATEERSVVKSAHSSVQTGTAVDQERYLKYSAPSTVADTKHKITSVGNFDYPPVPSPAADGRVICTYCCVRLTSAETDTEAAWIAHLELDLDQFVCLSDTCELSRETMLFERRSEWLNHMRTVHGTSWRCLACRSADTHFQERQQMENHMMTTHPSTFKTNSDLKALVDSCAMTPSKVFESCPLCGCTEDELKITLETHVADHLKALALSTLWQFNRLVDNDDQEAQGSDEAVADQQRTRSTVEEELSPKTSSSRKGWTPPSEEDLKQSPMSSDVLGDLGNTEEILEGDIVEVCWNAREFIAVREFQWGLLLDESRDDTGRGGPLAEGPRTAKVEQGTIIEVKADEAWLLDVWWLSDVWRLPDDPSMDTREITAPVSSFTHARISHSLHPAIKQLRLLNTRSMELHVFADGVPAYTIVSHEWVHRAGEARYSDFLDGTVDQQRGYNKLLGAVRIAREDGHDWLWIDTACIDMDDEEERAYTVKYMWLIYEASSRCYVHLADVIASDDPAGAQFRSSRWFTRGWTLQELLAPQDIQFFDCDWKWIGDLSDETWLSTVSEITEIPVDALSHRRPLSDFSVAQRLSWAAHRTTTIEEDAAYCLLGVFGVDMDINYGEDIRAFQRLQCHIIDANPSDLSILAWKEVPYADEPPSRTILAPSPRNFWNCSDLLLSRLPKSYEIRLLPAFSSIQDEISSVQVTSTGRLARPF